MYEEILETLSSQQEAERFLFQEFGSGTASDYLHTHHYAGKKAGCGCSCSWEVFSKKYFGFVYALKKKKVIALPLDFIIMIGKSLQYLLDIIKDFRFLMLLATLNPCPILLIVIGWLSLGLSEVSKIWYWCRLPGVSKARKVVLCFLSPVAQVLLQTEKFLLEMKINEFKCYQGVCVHAA